MAYTSCAAELAANIAQDCSQPNVAGYTGRAVYIPYSVSPTLAKSASNARIISDISIDSSAKVVAVDNSLVGDNSFAGSTTELNTDNGRAEYQKTVALRVPQRGGAASLQVVEPLVTSPLGGMMILEKRDTRGDGSFEVVGAERGLKATSVTRNEYEAGADWQANLQTTEHFAEYVLFDTDYATTLAKFEALLAKSY